MIFALRNGEMAEWSKAHAWRACDGKTVRGFKSHSLRQAIRINLVRTGTTVPVLSLNETKR